MHIQPTLIGAVSIFLWFTTRAEHSIRCPGTQPTILYSLPTEQLPSRPERCGPLSSVSVFHSSYFASLPRLHFIRVSLATLRTPTHLLSSINLAPPIHCGNEHNQFCIRVFWSSITSITLRRPKQESVLNFLSFRLLATRPQLDLPTVSCAQHRTVALRVWCDSVRRRAQKQTANLVGSSTDVCTCLSLVRARRTLTWSAILACCAHTGTPEPNREQSSNLTHYIAV